MQAIDTTVLVHTFMRPAVCERLLRSIETYYPGVPVVVYDDTDHDIGLSAGRNKLVKEATTPYVMVLDDDCIFGTNTNVAKAESLLEQSQLDILGIGETENGSILCYNGTFVERDGTVYYSRESRDGLYDFVANAFIAKRQSLLDHPWDDSLKMGEHFAFFHKHAGTMRIGYTSEISVIHDHVDTPGYQKFRGRAMSYVMDYMRKNNIKRRVDLGGGIVEA